MKPSLAKLTLNDCPCVRGVHFWRPLYGSSHWFYTKFICWNCDRVVKVWFW